LRKLALLAPIFALVLSSHLAAAQQGDVFIGGGTLLSSSSNNGSLPSENGGLYMSLGGDVVLHNRLGVNIETAWRATQGVYGSGSGLNYRPILTDFNLLFQPRLGKKAGLDLMAGIGPASTRFYTPGPSSPGYANYESTDHFMEHLGAGIRYYVWRHVFVRPEIHYYHIQSNSNTNNNGFFNTDNVFRVSGSIGYTIGNGD